MNEEEKSLYRMIDLLASEYGWSIDYIQTLSMLEINNLVEIINERKKAEWRIQSYLVNCAMAGKNPKLDGDDNKENNEENIGIKETESLLKLSKMGIIEIKRE